MLSLRPVKKKKRPEGPVCPVRPDCQVLAHNSTIRHQAINIWNRQFHKEVNTFKKRMRKYVGPVHERAEQVNELNLGEGTI